MCGRPRLAPLLENKKAAALATVESRRQSAQEAALQEHLILNLDNNISFSGGNPGSCCFLARIKRKGKMLLSEYFDNKEEAALAVARCKATL